MFYQEEKYIVSPIATSHTPSLSKVSYINIAWGGFSNQTFKAFEWMMASVCVVCDIGIMTRFIFS